MLHSSVPWVLLLGLCMTSCAAGPDPAPEISPFQRFQQEREREDEAEFARLESGCFAESKVEACESLGWLSIHSGAHAERICQSQIRSCSKNGFFGCDRIFERCTTMSDGEKIAAMEKALVEMCGAHREESCERLSREYSRGHLSSIFTIDKKRFIDNARCTFHEAKACNYAIKNAIGGDQPDKALALARAYACEQPGNTDACDVQASYYLIKALLDYSVQSSEELRRQTAPLLQQVTLLLYTGCLADDEAACGFLRSGFDWSHYPQESEDQFLSLLDKDCTRNSRLNACLLLARRSDRKEHKRLGQKLVLMCRAAKGREASCFNQAGEALENFGSVQQRKYLFQQACLGGELRGCEHWAEELKWDFHPNYRPVAQAMRTSCKGEEKCLLHAGMLLTQAGDTKDSALLINPLCKQGSVDACEAVALGLVNSSSAKDRHRGATLLQDLCTKGKGVSCFSLARLYALGKGGLKQSTGFAEEAAQKACNLGVSEACPSPDGLSDRSFPSSRGYSSWGSTAEQLGSAGKAIGGLVISPVLLPFCILGIKRNVLCPLSW
jgi:hypothetical protein